MSKIHPIPNNNFFIEIKDAKDELVKSVSKTDILTHFEKIITWQNIFFMAGLSGIWIKYNIISIVSFSIFLVSRWVITAHHVCHGGYDKCDKYPYKRSTFGVGLRRFIDWFDWFSVDAWKFEHNKFHHYYLNESSDPDLIEQVHEKYLIHDSFFMKNIKFIFIMTTWRWVYYTSNTFYTCYSKCKTETTLLNHIFFINRDVSYAFGKVFFPYLVFRFMLTPLCFSLLFGSSYFFYTLINLMLAELLANIYSFAIVATNHCGSDLYRFSNSDVSENGRIYRAIIGSVNYPYGSEATDFLHGYLNYQIEHHMFPDLSCLEYKLLAPKIKNICEKYKVNYIQENVLKRLYKTYKIYVGIDKMKVF